VGARVKVPTNHYTPLPPPLTVRAGIRGSDQPKKKNIYQIIDLWQWQWWQWEGELTVVVCILYA